MTKRELIPLADAAEMLAVTRVTLQNWKKKNFGPTMLKIGARQCYRRTDIENFIAGLTAGDARPGLEAVRARIQRTPKATPQPTEAAERPKRGRPRKGHPEAVVA